MTVLRLQAGITPGHGNVGRSQATSRERKKSSKNKNRLNGTLSWASNLNPAEENEINFL